MKKTQNGFVTRLIKQAIFIIALFAVITALIGVEVIDSYMASLLSLSCIYVIVALGVNLVTGMTGQLVLGHAGFMAIGGYCTAILLKNLHVPMVPALLAGGVLSGLVGLVIGFPTLRLKGDYLAIVTLGFGEIIRVVLNNLDSITGGAAGFMGIPGFTGFGGNQALASIVINSVFMVLAILTVVHLMTSSHGRALVTIRDDEIAAESIGLNSFYTKMFAFTVSTFLAGVAGGLFAMQNGFLSPVIFNFLKSMDILIIVVFGGMGSLTGTVAASFVLTLLQEQLRVLMDYRLVIYPLLLILMMIFRPQGLLGTKELKLTDTLLSRRWWVEDYPVLRRKLAGKLAARKKGAEGNGNS